MEGVVTSLAVTPEGIVFCGTDQSNIYEIKNTADLSVVELESTSHFSRINDVTFAWYAFAFWCWSSEHGGYFA